MTIRSIASFIGATLRGISLACIASTALAQGSEPPAAISIAEARSASPGTLVSVSGRVMSAPGAFASWSFDKGFLIQDQTAGIYVSVADDPGFELNDRVTVSGMLSSYYQLLIIAADSGSLARAPENRMRIPTGSIGEETEGSLVSVEGAITRAVVDDPPYGFKLYVDDGSGELLVFLSTLIDAPSIKWLRAGQSVRVTGMSGQFQDHYELNPRSRQDIQRVETSGGRKTHEYVRLAMFSDAACEKPLLQIGLPFIVTMDTGQACFSFSYTDPAGLAVPTSHANFRCEKDKLLYDKYPFSSECKLSTTSNAEPTKGYSISNTCQFAASHTGGVYEKLVGYQYPGNAACVDSR